MLLCTLTSDDSCRMTQEMEQKCEKVLIIVYTCVKVPVKFSIEVLLVSQPF